MAGALLSAIPRGLKPRGGLKHAKTHFPTPMSKIPRGLKPRGGLKPGIGHAGHHLPDSPGPQAPGRIETRWRRVCSGTAYSPGPQAPGRIETSNFFGAYPHPCIPRGLKPRGGLKQALVADPGDLTLIPRGLKPRGGLKPCDVEWIRSIVGFPGASSPGAD